MIKQDIISFILITIMVVSGCLAFYGSILSVNENLDRKDKCKSLGGIPQTDRGEYISCAKSDNFIDIGGKQ